MNEDLRRYVVEPAREGDALSADVAHYRDDIWALNGFADRVPVVYHGTDLAGLRSIRRYGLGTKKWNSAMHHAEALYTELTEESRLWLAEKYDYAPGYEHPDDAYRSYSERAKRRFNDRYEGWSEDVDRLFRKDNPKMFFTWVSPDYGTAAVYAKQGTPVLRVNIGAWIEETDEWGLVMEDHAEGFGILCPRRVPARFIEDADDA